STAPRTAMKPNGRREQSWEDERRRSPYHRPMVSRMRRVSLVVVLLASCGGGGDPEGPRAAPPAPVASSPPPAPTATAPPAGTPVVLSVGSLDQLAVGGDDTCVRTHDKAIHCWGRNLEIEHSAEPRTKPSIVPSMSDATEIELGEYHACIRKSDA